MDLEDVGCWARFLIRDRDEKFPTLFDAILADAGIEVVLSGVRMPRMNSIMERWVQTCRHELLDRTLIWNLQYLFHALREFETVSAPTWSTNQTERNSFFAAPANQALVGRYHSGDENGPTRYATASMSVAGRTVNLTSYRWTAGQRESASYSKAAESEVMVGRQHSGDENGQTSYQYARISGT